MIESLILYLQDLAVNTQQNYGVNPWIFIPLFFGSAIPLYYGYYRIGKSVVKFEHGKIIKKKLDKAELKKGIVIASAAWVLPYIYVVFWGHLPLKGWLVFATFVAVMGIFFIKRLRFEIKTVKKKTKA